MGPMNEFVDANIATLQVLMQEKRKLFMLIEEQHVNLTATHNETYNFSMQLDLLHQDRDLTLMRHTTLVS